MTQSPPRHPEERPRRRDLSPEPLAPEVDLRHRERRQWRGGNHVSFRLDLDDPAAEDRAADDARGAPGDGGGSVRTRETPLEAVARVGGDIPAEADDDGGDGRRKLPSILLLGPTMRYAPHSAGGRGGGCNAMVGLPD